MTGHALISVLFELSSSLEHSPNKRAVRVTGSDPCNDAGTIVQLHWLCDRGIRFAAEWHSHILTGVRRGVALPRAMRSVPETVLPTYACK